MTLRFRRSAAAYLAARTRIGMKFGLDTMRVIVDALDHPERSYATLLVAGTNGKGSVAAYLDAALRASALRVGRYTSPHLVRVNERITVDGRAISERDLDVTVERVRVVVERLVRERRLRAHHTYFETLTAAAFEYFRARRVQVAVLEIGMGGRLDATNVADPIVSAIVSIARDHEAYLGSTLAAIAREKAGVMRRGRVTVLGALPPDARRAIAAEAVRQGAKLVDAPRDTSVHLTPGGLRIQTPRGTYRGLRPLAGSHQILNLLVAIRVLEHAEAAGIPVTWRGFAEAIRRVVWPGRSHWVAGAPRLLLDGAHNPAGARALAEYLGEDGHPYVLLFGAMADKDIAGMAQALFPRATGIILTRVPNKRAASPREIARRATTWAQRAILDPRPDRALKRARREAGRKGTIVVTGSLYLVGDVLNRLRRRGKSRRTRSPRPGS